jgi:S1-C subfamily serine protease
MVTEFQSPYFFMKSLICFGLTLNLMGGIFFIPSLIQSPIAVALSESEVLKRLESSPVFVVTNQDNVPILGKTVNPKDRSKKIQVMTFFMSQQDAHNLVMKIKEQKPDIGKNAKVTILSMRQAYNIKGKNKDKADSLVIEFKPTKQQVDDAIEILGQNGKTVKEFKDIPLFYAIGGPKKGLLTIEQKNKKVIPFYFNLQDLKVMLDQLKKKDPELSIATTVQATSLSQIVSALQKNNGTGVEKITLVPDRAALQYAMEQQKTSPSKVTFNSNNLNPTTGTSGIPSSNSDTAKNTPTQPLLVKSTTNQSISSEEIYKIANEITVSIRGKNNNNGSGVLISKEGKSYYVLTSKHVISSADNYVVITPDNKQYSVNYKDVKKLPKIDLSILEFTSDRTYKIAQLNTSKNTKQGESIFISGFPSGGQAIKLPTHIVTDGKISGFQKGDPDGYELLYNNSTAPGMSGGPILNASGLVIGIHGRAEGNDMSEKVGINLGIPINFFFQEASQLGINLKKLGLKAEK